MVTVLAAAEAQEVAEVAVVDEAAAEAQEAVAEMAEVRLRREGEVATAEMQMMTVLVYLQRDLNLRVRPMEMLESRRNQPQV